MIERYTLKLAPRWRPDDARQVPHCLARSSLHNALILHQLLVVLIVNLFRFHRGLERLPGTLPLRCQRSCAQLEL
jgi:hypothetical protein